METRGRSYKRIMSDAISKMLTELEDIGFDADAITIKIELYNQDFDDSMTLEG